MKKLETLEREIEKLYKENLDINLSPDSSHFKNIKKSLSSSSVFKMRKLIDVSPF